MDTVNAIAKARFASAKPQRVQLHKADGLSIDLLCLEPRQEMSVRGGQWTYYTIAGSVVLEAGDQRLEVGTGHVAATADGERHKLSNAAETRLICLAVGHGL